MGKKLSKKSQLDFSYEDDQCTNNESTTIRSITHDLAFTSLDVMKNAVIICGDQEGELLTFNLSNNCLINKSKIHERGITQVLNTNLSYQQCCLTSSRDKTVKYFDYNSQSTLQTLVGHTMPVTAISSNSECTELISGSRDCSVKLWNIETGTAIKSAMINRNVVTALKILESENAVVQCAEDKMMKLLDYRTLKTTSTFPMKQYFQTCCDVIGYNILTGSTGCDGSGCDVTVWDIRQLKPITNMKGHREKVTSCRFVNGGEQVNRVLSVSHDCSIKIWDSSTGECLTSQVVGGAKELTSLAVDNENSIYVGTFNGNVHKYTYNQVTSALSHVF